MKGTEKTNERLEISNLTLLTQEQVKYYYTVTSDVYCLVLDVIWKHTQTKKSSR